MLTTIPSPPPFFFFSIAECGIGIVCACFPLLPALWKSIFNKQKPGYSYSSNTKSQFEMMNSSKKNSRNATHNHGTITYKDQTDSDENNLIAPGKPFVTTNIRAGEDEERSSSAGAQSGSRNRSFDESQIVRTVEVRQYAEH